MASMWHKAPVKQSGKYGHKTSGSDVQVCIFTYSFEWLVSPCFPILKRDQISNKSQSLKLTTFFTSLVVLITAFIERERLWESDNYL